MCSPPCMDQAISHPPVDFTVDNSLAGRKCATTLKEKEHNLAQKLFFPGKGGDPFHKKQKMQAKKKIPKRTFLALYEDHLKEKVKEAGPSARIGNRLFEEIKAKGYRGSLSTVKKFLHRVYRESEFPKEAFLSYYKGYLKKRLEKAEPNCVSTRKLFNEITAKGYRGSLSAVGKFLWTIRRQAKTAEASIQFHKEYLIKRIKGASPDFVPGTELLEEIKAKGYRGSVNTFQAFLSALRKQEKRPSEVSLDFHKDYLTKRIKDALPDPISSAQLFKEIKAKGYRGSFNTLRSFLLMIRKHEKKLSEDLSSASVEFHKDYLAKRLEEAYPSYVSGPELFKEIRSKGYQRSLRTLQEFLSTLRKQKKRPSEACVEFHEEYLIKRIKDAYPKHVSGPELFKEIRAKGYQGSLIILQRFLSTLRKQEESLGKKSFSEPYKNDLPKQLNRAPLVHRNVLPKESLQFHKDYLIKILQETWPSRLSPEQLFEEIISRGYRGTCKEVEVFLMMISK